MGVDYLIDLPRQPKKKYTSNYISTTKYNIISFIPFSLLLQFKRYANIYFLACAILQSIPLISPLNPASAIAPLVFVLFLSMTREGFEDYKRWKSDKENNKSETHIYQGTQLKKYQWKNIKQGDIVRLKSDEIVPADLIVLVSSETSGISYVETSSLDGEKNLKPKLSITETQEFYNNKNTLPDFASLRGSIKCSDPSPLNIEAFIARVKISFSDSGLEELDCDINKKYMLHRGSKIKNTDWVVGLACYCGKETAVMMNGSEPYTKTSNIERMVNKIIIVIFVFELLCAFGSAVYCYFKCQSHLEFEVLIRQTQNIDCVSIAAIALGSYFLLYNTFIPISLIVSLEFVKVFQGGFMERDKEMYCGINDRKTECHSVSINEELGQIEYILTDKTGTLTCNKMEFRNVVVGNQIYGEDLILKSVSEGFDFRQLSRRHTIVPGEAESQKSRDFQSNRIDYELKGNENKDKTSYNRKSIEEIFFMIATCHECIVSNGHYQGPSPDEVALVQAAKKIGFQFISTENKVTIVQYKEKKYRFKILKMIEFDSDRKRMTVVLQTDSVIKVYVKGADTSITKLLAPNQKYLESIKQKTEEMTRTGLRSLWFAYKEYPLKTNINNLSEQQLEGELDLVGATGIEDRLQDFVPETIFALREGGIKFVMLTGDKLETAENIAISCRLIDEGFLINSKERIKAFLQDMQQKRNKQFYLISPVSPVIDGSSINFEENESDLLYIIPRVKSLVFCRVTPGQKAEIVRLVKRLGKLTLAVGDGANDTNMIMEAHVGVGIFGEEGTRAAQVSNYAIGEFCILYKLLLHYGRLNYMRISEMILYSFYKNMVFTIVQFVYCFYNNGSGHSFWFSWPITLFNMIFTFMPVVLRAVFEVDIDIASNKKTFKEVSQGNHHNQLLYSYFPKMYLISQKNQLFTKLIFFEWFALGMSQGAICLIVTLYILGDVNDTSGFDSYPSGLYFAEISAYTSVIIIVTVKIAINIKQWNVILVLGFLIPTVGAYILYRILSNELLISELYGFTSNLLTMPNFYLAQILCIMGMFSLDFLLFSVGATKSNFQNYLKYRTIRERNLSVSHLDKYMLEMETSERNSRISKY